MASKIQIDALNCGAGDIKLSFNANDPMEVERAKRVIEDMLKRGYALFLQGSDGKMIRVKKFDAKKGEYIIAAGATIDPVDGEVVSEPKVKTRKEEKVKMSHAKVTAVGRSAGG